MWVLPTDPVRTLLRSVFGGPTASDGPCKAADSRVRVRAERMHIAVRGLQEPDGDRIADTVEQRLADLPGVLWASVNSPLGEAVVATDGTADLDPETSAEAIVGVVEAVESEYGLDGPVPECPLSDAAVGRAAAALAVHVVALPVVAVTRLTRRTPVPAIVSPLLNLVDAEPRLRRLVDRALGADDTTLPRAVLGAAANAGAGLVVGLGVDTARHALRLVELRAQRAAWLAAEPRLTATAGQFSAPRAGDGAREVPLHGGPVERYADRAAAVAGASVAATLALTRMPLRAAGAAVSAIPKAPWLAREAFASVLGHGLARRGLLVAEPEALRRLDRIDIAVLDTEALTTGAYQLTDLHPLDGPEGPEGPEEDIGPGELAAVAHRLFDPLHPGRIREDESGEWRLRPTDAEAPPRPDSPEASPPPAGTTYVLAVERHGRPLALVGVVPELDEASDALVAAARRAHLRVLCTGPDKDLPVVPDTDGHVEGGERLPASLRALQRDGSGVLLLSRRREALAAADLGAGLTDRHGRDAAPPWGAHVHVGTNAAQAVTLLEACQAAQNVSRYGVRLAEASAGLGSAMTVAGGTQPTVARLMSTVNGAAAMGMAAGAWSAARLLARPAPVAQTRHPWHAMDPDTVLARTGSDGERGLTAEAVRERRAATAPAERGEDAIPRPSLARAVVTEAVNPLTPVLGGGAALSAAVGAVLDAWLILAVTVMSFSIGGTQRFLADRTAARLYHRSTVPARVVRDGEESEVPTERLVVGDVVMLTAGDVVPADCRLLTADGVEADESALTGESLPVAKSVAPVLASDLAERSSMVYEGTTLAAGQARAVVVATGAATEAGREDPADQDGTPAVGVERRLAQITRATLPAALASAAVLIGLGLVRGRPVRETIGAAVGLAVASVPEGLPFLVTAAQLAAARRLAAEGVFVRDARTIEAAGRTDVLCFDKTGTLTRGRLSLTAVHADGRTLPLDRLSPQHRAVLAVGLRATPRTRERRHLAHVTDTAVATGAAASGVRRSGAAPGWKRTAALPFEPSRAFHAALGHSGKDRVLSVKGAPEEVVDRCTLTPERRRAVLATSRKLAATGHRVLAVAEHRDSRPAGTALTDEDVTGLDFLGFLLLLDEVRAGVGEPIARLGEAGVHIVMITGDHPGTADSIARELGLVNGRKVVTGADLDALDDDRLDALLPQVGVVARATPHHKVRVVRAFQRTGRTVAMTGDGANDAPAIRLADVGIAFGGQSTPAARAAADLVVTDARLEPVLATLIEGRAMWASVRQALGILVGGNLGEITFTVLAAAITGNSPLTARQLLLVNLFTDLAPSVAIAVRPPRGVRTGDLLEEGPEASLGTALADETGVRATATAGAALAAWLLARPTGRVARARTIALIALVGAQLGQTLVAGHRSPTVLAASLGSLAVLAAVVQTPGVSHFFGCTPLGPIGWGIALTASAAGTAAAPALRPVIRRVRMAASGEY